MKYNRQLTDEEFKFFLLNDYSEKSFSELITFGLPDSQKKMYNAFIAGDEIKFFEDPFPSVKLSHNHVVLVKEEKIWEVIIVDSLIYLKTGKLSGGMRERIHKPKSVLGKTNPEWEVKNLIWKKFKEGFKRQITSDSELLLQIPTPEHLCSSKIDIFPEGKIAIVNQDQDGKGSRVYKINLESGEQSLILHHDSFLIKSIKCLANGKSFLFTPQTNNGWQTCKFELETLTFTILAENEFTQFNSILEISTLGQIVHATGENLYQVIDKDNRILLTEKLIPTKHNFGPVITFSACGNFLILAFQPVDENEMNILRIHNLSLGISFNYQTNQNKPIDGICSLGKRIYLKERFSKIQIFELHSDKIIFINEIENFDCSSLFSSIKENQIGVYDNGRLITLDQDGKVLFKIEEALHLKGTSAKFLPDSKVLFTGAGIISVVKLDF